MIELPLISVIVPVYNVRNYIGRCLDSLISQTYTNFEILLVDDGSLDDSGLICDNYALKDSRIRVFHKSNGGVSSARNCGLSKATGQWICFIDSDDWVENNFLETLYSGISSGTDIVELKNIGYKFENFYTYISSDNFLFSVWNMLFKSSVVSGITFKENIKIGEDLIFLLQIFDRTKNINVVTTPPLYNYFTRDDSAMHQIRSQVDCDIKLVEHMHKILGIKSLYLPIYYRFLIDATKEFQNKNSLLLVKETILDFRAKDYIGILFKDPKLLLKCFVRSAQVYFHSLKK